MKRRHVKAVAFDCYGTLVRISRPTGVTRRIARIVGGRMDPSPMTIDRPLIDQLRTAAPKADPLEIEALARDLADEVASVEPIPGARETLRSFVGSGLSVALASNLAQDYGRPLGRMLDVETRALSYQIGAVKPEPRFYDALCAMLDAAPHEILMVGDTFASDYQGATAAGLRAVHLGVRDDVPSIAAISDLPRWFRENIASA